MAMSDVERLKQYQKLGLAPKKLVESVEKPPVVIRQRVAPPPSPPKAKPSPPPPVKPVEGFPTGKPEEPEEKFTPTEIIKTEISPKIKEAKTAQSKIDPKGRYYMGKHRFSMLPGQFFIKAHYEPYIEQLETMKSEFEQLPTDTFITKGYRGSYKIHLPPTTVKEETGFRYGVKPQSVKTKSITETGQQILATKKTDIKMPEIIRDILAVYTTAGPDYAIASLKGPTWKPGDPLINPQMQQMIKHKQTILETKWQRGDIFGLFSEVATAPLTTVPLAYGIGWGIGAFKTTAIGSKALLVSKGLTKAGKPLYTITPSTLLEGGLVGFGAYETGRSMVDDPGRTLFHLAATMPFIIPSYKWGYHSGMGYMQRKAALSRVSGLDRVRQKGIYEAMDITSGLHEPPHLGEPVFDLTSITRISYKTAVTVSKYLKSEQRWGILGGRPRIGGSASAKMQLGEYFRTGDIPKLLKDWAIKRQTTPHPLIGKTPPMDIDLLVYSHLGGFKRASPLKRPHVVDIHTYKVGEHLWGGKTQLPSTTGYLPSGKVKLLSIREQFFRESISILPSETEITGYRSYKDIPSWYELGDILSFQKGGTKLRGAMDKVIHPSRYPIPKRTLSERIIGRLGVKPFTETTPTGDIYYNLPKYPSYPSYGIGLLYARYPTYKTIAGGGYRSPPYKPKISLVSPPPLVPPYKHDKTRPKTPMSIPPDIPYKTILPPSRKTPPTRPYKISYPPAPPPPSPPPTKTPGYEKDIFKRVPPSKIRLDIWGETKPVKPLGFKRFWGPKYKTRYWEDIKGVKLPDIFKKVI